MGIIFPAAGLDIFLHPCPCPLTELLNTIHSLFPIAQNRIKVPSILYKRPGKYYYDWCCGTDIIVFQSIEKGEIIAPLLLTFPPADNHAF